MMSVELEKTDREVADAIDGEIIVSEDIDTRLTVRPDTKRRAYLVYVYLPLIFLTVALLGGLRFATDASFVFIKPSLVCLILAAMLLVLFVRAGAIRSGSWFSEEFSLLTNLSRAVVIGSVYAASVQLFNSLIPEQGLTYWVVTFCFFWTLWNNVFAEFDVRRLMRSLAALFGLAFVAKYLILFNLASPAEQGWLDTILKNPTQSAATWLLDIPRFSSATGYVQFFTIALYMLGLYLFPAEPKRKVDKTLISA
jgi:hypothetical protein